MNSKRVLTGAILVAMLVLPATAAPPGSKSAADRDAAVAGKWIAGWNSHDPDKMLPLFTDDIFYEDVAFGEVSHGRAEVRKFVLSELEGVPDLELKLERADIEASLALLTFRPPTLQLSPGKICAETFAQFSAAMKRMYRIDAS